MNSCPKCGEENKVDTNFCLNCGHNLNIGIPEPHDGLIKLGYILAVIGPYLILYRDNRCNHYWYYFIW